VTVIVAEIYGLILFFCLVTCCVRGGRSISTVHSHSRLVVSICCRLVYTHNLGHNKPSVASSFFFLYCKSRIILALILRSRIADEWQDPTYLNLSSSSNKWIFLYSLFPFGDFAVGWNMIGTYHVSTHSTSSDSYRFAPAATEDAASRPAQISTASGRSRSDPAQDDADFP